MKNTFLILAIILGGCSSIPAQIKRPLFPLASMTPSPSAAPTLPIITTSPKDIFALNRQLIHTVNLGNALEAPNEGEWGVTLQEDYFRLIAQAGFSAVRIPIAFSAHAGMTQPYSIDPSFLSRIDWAIRQAASHGLTAILDMHNYPAMMDSPQTEKPRFLSLWQQIAERYKRMPDDQVFFELLNEPYNRLDDAEWNGIASETVTLIRRSNPTRPLIIGPSSWNGFDHVPFLQLPDDSNLIVTFHYYLPFQFTHQGAEWVDGSQAWLGTTWEGTKTQVATIQGDFDSVAQWASAHNRPIFLGEFGAYSKTDIQARARWTTAVRSSAEAHGFSWGYWEFCAGFGAFDPIAYHWRPELLQALIPSP